MRIPSAGQAIPLLVILSLAFASPGLWAQDFSFHEVGTRAAGLGGAFTAQADDSSAAFYNPAGLAFLDGFRIKACLNFAARSLRAVWPGTGQEITSSPHELTGNFYLSWQPVKRVTVGFGYYSPYGFDSAWPDPWAGDHVSVGAKVRTRTFRPVLAVEPLRGLALGAALDLVSMRVSWDHALAFDMDSYDIHERVLSRNEATGHGLGFAAGVLWKAFSRLQIGARYQQNAAVDLAGVDRFVIRWETSGRLIPGLNGSTVVLSQLLNLYYSPQEVTGRLTLPREIACGLVIRPVRRAALNLEWLWQGWGEFGRWEFRSVNADGDLAPEFLEVHEEFYGVTPDYGTQGADLAVRDSKTYRAGLEYRLGKWFAVRGGFARLKSSVEVSGRTPLYPDPAFRIYSVGAGYEGPLFSIWDDEKAVSRLSFDIFMRYAAADGSISTLPGLEMTYRANRWSAGVDVGFIF